MDSALDHTSIEIEIDFFPFGKTITIDGSPVIIDDEIEGTEDADPLDGDDNSNSISGKGSNDLISGKGGFDLLSGDEGDDTISGGSGGDRISGGRGDDLLNGNSGNDQIAGGAGRDRLFGGTGRDVLIGDRDNDVMVGGTGKDGFVLTTRGGVDRILDFEDGIDLIGIQGRGSVTFEDLTIRSRGANTVIIVDQKPIAVLVGVEANTIGFDDFANVITAL